MSAPRLTRPLVLEERVRVADGVGGYGVSWVARGTLWADLRPVSGRDSRAEEVVMAAVTCRIVVRGRRRGRPRGLCRGSACAMGRACLPFWR